MTREEEIKAKSKEFLPDILDDEYPYRAEFVFGFQGGAKWADETMIEKACKWLLHQEEMIGISFEDDFIERFKKAMEL